MTGYDVIECEKINPTDEEKVNEIAESIKANGWTGCPILMYGNILLTGSHRHDALVKLADEGFDISFECGIDVSDIIEEKLESGMEMSEIFDNLDYLRAIFEGTYVEQYKDELTEW